MTQMVGIESVSVVFVEIKQQMTHTHRQPLFANQRSAIVVWKTFLIIWQKQK